MVLLAIDTSEETCSVALLCASDVLAAKAERLGRGHAERLLPLIDECLAAASLSYDDLSKVAVTTGPGTFTGLRVGLSVARGLALALNLPCVGLSGLQVHAASAANKLGCDTVYAVIGGRGGQVFMQKFSGSSQLPTALGEAENLDLDVAIEQVKAGACMVVGSHEEAIGRFRESGLSTLFLEAIDVAMLGRLAHDLSPEIYPPEPLYLRAADAKKAVPLLPIEQTS